MIGRVGEIVVDELAHLHDEEGVGGVGDVGAAVGGSLGGEHVAHLPGGGQLKVVGRAAPRQVDGAAGVLGQQDALVGRPRPPKVGLGQVVARTVVASVYLNICTHVSLYFRS